MGTQHLKIIAGCLALVSLIIVTLYRSSPLSKPIYRGSFERKFNQTTLEEKFVISLPYNSYYIAGTGTSEIYLGNWTNPFHMITVKTHPLDTQHVELAIRHPEKIKDYEGFKLKVDSPYFFLMNGSLPGLFRGNLNYGEADHFIPDSAYFVDAEPIGASSFAMRSYSAVTKEFDLAKESNEPPYFKFNFELLEKQIDGLFCVKGMLHYSRELNRIVYLYTYRNQYIVLDTNLNLAYRANTIDTFSHAPIKTAFIESKNSNVLTGLPNVINIRSCVSGDYLFVNSNLLATNENEKDFLNAAVIDVYDLRKARYTQSFYLPNYKNIRPDDVILSNEKLAALYDQYLILYIVDMTSFSVDHFEEDIILSR